MKKQFIIFAFIALFIGVIPTHQSMAEELSSRLKGRILLQVQSKGEAWYVNPKDSKRYYMANGSEAYNIMRDLGVGINNKDLDNIKANKIAAKKQQGKIFLQVESRGEAYYVDINGNAHYLKDGEAAYQIMRELGLGINNNDLAKIPLSNKDKVLSSADSSAFITAQPTNQEFYKVTDVVDGDTIKVSINGEEKTLRLIGIDTPETVDPRKPVQCFGKEASNKAKELLSGKKVSIEKDSTQGNLDKYGRTLAYIYLEDGIFYNKYMIEQGYAHEYTYDTSYKYQADFKAAQKAAEENQRGLWSSDTCNGNTTSSAASSIPPQTDKTNQSIGKYYTSSYKTSKYFYPVACSGWYSLDKSYLKAFDSLEDLLAAYPSRTLNPNCQ